MSEIVTMTVKTKSGPGYHSEAVPTAYDGKFTLISAEPVEEGGSDKGPNPMTYGIMSFPVCEQEASMVIAESLGYSKEKWGKSDWKCEMDVNLDGYLGIQKEPMAAKDIFRRVFISAKPTTGNVTEEEVQAVRKGVKAACPMSRLFASIGTELVDPWGLGGHPENPELKDKGETTFRMGVTVVGDGLHSDVSVDDEAKHKVVLAEPEDEGGSGKGPNPMEALITSFAVCEFEQSLTIAKEMNVDAKWNCEMETNFEINLDGYMNKTPNMDVKDIFRKITSSVTVDTDTNQNTIDEIFKATEIRCPIVRLFADCGVSIEGKWTKK